MRLPRRVRVLEHYDYRLLFSGQVLSLLGDGMSPVAVTFAVLDHGGGARQVGVVLGAGTAAMVLFLLLGGVIADRLPRRSVMLAADAGRFVAQGAMALLLMSGHWAVWQLAVLQAVWGVGAAFFNPALTGLMPQLLSGDDLIQANALQSLARSLGSVIGPALGGVLVAVVGASIAIDVDAMTFLASAATLSGLVEGSLPGSAPVRSMLVDLREGWDAFRSRTWLWVIVLEFGLWHMLVYAPVIVLGAVEAKAHLGGASAWGAIMAFFGVGSLAGGLTALHVRPRRPLVLATATTALFAFLPVALAVGAPFAGVAVAALGGGFSFALFGVMWESTLQREVPPHLLSRVSAYDWFGSMALLPIGYVIVGPVSAALGSADTLWVAAGAMAAGIVGVLCVPGVRHLGGDVEAGRVLTPLAVPTPVP